MKTTKDNKEEKPKLLEEQRTDELPPQKEVGQIEGKERKLLADEEKRFKELEERLVRFQAEFDNFRKRTAKEHELLRQTAGAAVVLNLLEVVDEFGMAMEHAKNTEKGEFYEGMKIIYSKLLDTLKREGLEEMDADGQKLDPYTHDAIGFEEGEEGKILKVVKKGYLYRGKILRHAKVIVGRKN